MSTKTKDIAEKTMYGYNKKDYAKFKAFAWKMLLSFGLTYMFFYNGRQNINLVMSQMANDLGSTTAMMGVVSSAFFWCYAFGQLVNGRIGAIVGYKRYMMLGVAASAILNVVISFQYSILAISILWGLNGFFQSMVWSNGLGVVNTWWPKRERGFATGFITFFSGFAQVVTYISFLILNLDDNAWRPAFQIPMIPMALMLIVFAIFFKESPEKVGLAPFEEGDQAAAAQDEALIQQIKEKGALYPYKVLFSEPKVIIFCIISAIAGIGRYGLLNWIPLYFTESMGLSIKEGTFSAIVLPIGQACAMLVFPIVSDKVFKGKREPMLVILSVLTFCGMICFPFIRQTIPAMILLFIVAVCAMVTGIIWAIAGDIGGRAFSSTVVGVFDWAVYMGAALQAMLFGFVKDHFGWPAIFITIGSLYVIMLVLTLAAKNMKTKRI